MKQGTRTALVCLFGSIVIIGSPFIFLHVLHTAFHSELENNPIYGGERMEIAINSYIKKNGFPPKALDNLVPGFLPSIPRVPGVTNVQYFVSSDGKKWTLDLYHGEVIWRRTTAGLSAEDIGRLEGSNGGVYILGNH